MNLGDLEFKPEDFGRYPNRGFACDDPPLFIDKAVEIANRLLRERLAKAQEIRSDSIGRTAEWLHAERGLYATHRARLVCIEEIEK